MVKNAGFSLIEVLIVTAIISFLGLGISTILKNQSDMLFLLEDKLEQNQVIRSVDSMLSNPFMCTDLLGAVKNSFV